MFNFSMIVNYNIVGVWIFCFYCFVLFINYFMVKVVIVVGSSVGKDFWLVLW